MAKSSRTAKPGTRFSFRLSPPTTRYSSSPTTRSSSCCTRNVRQMTIKLAIVGRPNVGKSTLFNRLVGKKLAIVDDTPGVTRDRREAQGRLGDLDLQLIDTAGFEDATDASLEARMRAQTQVAINEAAVILFLIDARVGVTPV